MMEYFHSFCVKHKLKKKTLFMAAYVHDKYLELLGTSPSALEQACIGHACLLIAMKWEEIYPPFLSDWC